VMCVSLVDATTTSRTAVVPSLWMTAVVRLSNREARGRGIYLTPSPIQRKLYGIDTRSKSKEANQEVVG
jgi:hypothetical protein